MNVGVTVKIPSMAVDAGGRSVMTVSTGSPAVLEYPPYTGAVTVTPGETAVVLRTANTTLTGDITVEPIPDNYGLITWNGAVLTVS